MKMKDIVMIDRSPEQWLYYLFCGAFFLLPMGTSPFTILGVGILFIWVITGEFFKKRHGYLREPWLWPVLAMVALTWLGLIYSNDPDGLGIKFAKKSHYWLYALAVAGISINIISVENLIKAFLGGLLLNAMIGFLQLGSIVPVFYKGRYAGLSGGYNTLAILLIIGIMMVSFYFRKAGGKKGKFICIFMMLVYFTHLIILEGRGGYLTFAILSPIVAYNLSHGRHLLITFLLYLLAIDLMSFSPFVQQRVIDSIYDVEVQLRADSDIRWGKQYSEDDTLQRIDRIYMWRWAVDIFMQHPFSGVGTGGYKRAILSGGGGRGADHPHNNFLYMAVSFGIAGVLVLGWFFWVLLRNGWRYRRDPLGFFILSSGLVIFVGGLTDTHILDAGPAFLLAVTTGLQSGLPIARKVSNA